MNLLATLMVAMYLAFIIKVFSRLRQIQHDSKAYHERDMGQLRMTFFTPEEPTIKHLIGPNPLGVQALMIL